MEKYQKNIIKNQELSGCFLLSPKFSKALEKPLKFNSVKEVSISFQEFVFPTKSFRFSLENIRNFYEASLKAIRLFLLRGS